MNNKFRNKNLKELQEELAVLYKEKFKLLLEKSNDSKFKKNHLFKFIRKDIARIFTLIVKLKNEK